MADLGLDDDATGGLAALMPPAPAAAADPEGADALRAASPLLLPLPLLPLLPLARDRLMGFADGCCAGSCMPSSAALSRMALMDSSLSVSGRLRASCVA